MKIHLPLLLRRCLLACFSITCASSITAQASQQISLPDGTTWQVNPDTNTLEAPGYTGTSGDYYKVQGTWNILSGTYEISSTSYPISNGTLVNAGAVDIAQDADNYAYAIYLTNITNKTDGIVNITATSTNSFAYGVYGSTITNAEGASLTIQSNGSSNATGMGSVDFVNSGTVDITAQSANGTATGILYTSSITNEASGKLTINCYGPEADGIQQTSLINRGIVNITAESTTDPDVTGIVCNGNSGITNEAGGTLTISVRGGSSSNNTYGRTVGIDSMSSGGVLSNGGLVDVTVEAVSGNTTGINCPSITNEEGGIIRVQSNSSAGATGIRADSLINRGTIGVVAGGAGSALGISGVITNETSGSITVQSGCRGLVLTTGRSLTNSGKIDVTVAVETEEAVFAASGIDCYSGNTITNNTDGELTIRCSSGQNYAAGIGDCATLMNSGTISITAESAGYYAYGLYNCDVITNETSGSLKIQSTGKDGAYGIFGGTLTNRGRLEVLAQAERNAYGISMERVVNEQGAYLAASGSTAAIRIEDTEMFYNAGELKADSIQLSGTGALYMLDGATAGGHTEGAAMVCSGNGTLHLGGALDAEGTVAGLTTGSSMNSTSAFNISGVTLNLIDNVTLSMGGDLTVGSDVTRSWNGHGLTIDNGDSVHNVTIGDTLTASWDGAYTLHESTGSGLSLTTAQAGEQFGITQGKLVNSSIAATNISMDGITLDSTTLTLGTGTNTLNNVTFQGVSHIDSNSGGNITQSTLTNAGKLTTTAQGGNEGSHYGLYLSSSSLTNNGQLAATVQGESGSSIYAIYLNASTLLNEKNASLTADATITTSGTAVAQGIYLTNSSTLTNLGELTASVQGGNDRAAIKLSTKSTLHNSGTLTAEGDSSGINLNYYGSGGVTLINEEGGTVTSSGYSSGILGFGYTLDNRGVLEAKATGPSYRAMSCGIEAIVNATLSNSGELMATAQGIAAKYGIYLSRSSLTNEAGGVLSASATVTSSHNGLDTARGILVSGNSTLTNRGELTATAQAMDIATGIELKQSPLLNESGAILRADASITSGSIGTAHGLYLISSSVLTNQSELTATAQGESGGSFHGIYQDASSLINETGARLTANATISTSGSGTAYGMYITNSSSLTNSGQMTAWAQGGESSTNYGLYLSSSSLTNSGQMSITAQGENSSTNYGIYLDAGTLLNEEGASLTVESSTTTTTGSAVARGICLTNSATLNNKGIMTVTSLGGNDNSGIMGLVTNSGELTVNARWTGISSGNLVNEAGGTIQAKGGTYGIRGSLTNYGVMTATAAGATHRVSSSGIYSLYGSSTNNGVLTATAEGSALKHGIYLGDSSLTNESGAVLNAEASVTNSSSWSNTAWGILLTNNSSLTNKGELTATTQAYGINSAIGIDVEHGATVFNDAGASMTVINTGTAENKGIYIHNNEVKPASAFYNAGTLETNSVYMEGNGNTLYLLNGSTTGAYAEGRDLTIQGGTVQLGGELSADRSTVSFLDNGSAVNISSGLSISGGMLTLADNVTLAMRGDLTVGSDVTHTWNGYTLTVDNGGVMRSVTMGGISLSMDKTVSFTESDGKVSMVQNGGGSSTVNGGTIQATGSLSMGNSETQTKLKSDTDNLSLSANEGGVVTNTTMEAVNIAVSGSKNATLKLEDVTMTVQGGSLSLNNVEMSDTDDLSLSADKGGAVTNTSMEAVNISVSGSTEVSLKLDTVTVTIQGGTLTLNNVEIRGITTFQFQPTESIDSMVTAILNNVTFVLGEGNSIEMPQMATFSLADAMEEASEPEESTFLIYSNMMENLNVNGQATLDLSSYYSQIANNGNDSVGIMFTENTAFADDAIVTATFDGKNLAQAYKNEDGVMYFAVNDMGTVAVPEPTTATLSLLALSALAARRRRRAA